MIYVLLLEEQKIYVGFTARPLGERFLEHFSGVGSKWTQKYKPLEILYIFEGGKIVEDQMTLEMMDRYGWYNVRGGSWCQVEMSSCPPALLEYKGLKLPPELGMKNCLRCGRNSHEIYTCNAKTDLKGFPLKSKMNITCLRGRPIKAIFEEDEGIDDQMQALRIK